MSYESLRILSVATAVVFKIQERSAWVQCKSGSPEKQRSACIVVGVFEPRRLSPIAEQLDKISDGYISALLRRGELEGKPGQTLLLHHVPNVLSERILTHWFVAKGASDEAPVQTGHSENHQYAE